jgi:type IV pilus assembly protein PilY1
MSLARRHLLAAGAVGVALATISGLAAAACDIPLVTRRATSAANVMVLLDNSGSMNEVIYHSAFDPGTTYSGNFGSTTSYDVGADANYTPRSFNSTWPSTPTAYLVNSDAGENGQYIGNYLNWVFFHATDTQRGEIPRVTRIQVAKQVVNTVISSAPTHRYGIMTFNGDDGGTLTSAVGTAISTIQTQVNAVRASSWTPLAETMVDILDYFKLTSASAPIQAACQKSFVVIVSDGYPTQDLDVPGYLQDYDGDGQDPGTCASLGAPPGSSNCSGYLDDVAKYMFDTDLRTDLTGTQNLTTFVVGFSINAPILQAAATKGGGTFYNANNASELATAMTDALSQIEAQVSAGTSVSVVSAEDRTNNRLHRARYETASWMGFLEAFALPHTSGDTPVWEAGSLLSSRDPNTRNIFTSTTGTNKFAFTASNATTLMSSLGAATSTEATNIIQYARGNAVAGTRDRAGWKLGDIVDSSPITVGKPSEYHDYLSYGSFASGNASRDEMIYVGANDGMLHAFKASDGSEAWAYVPSNQLSKLSGLMSPSYCHTYFVNMTPAVHDIYIGGSWKTVLIGGQERGGSGLFALDVTDPRSSQMNVLWDVDLPALKGSWTRPELVRDRTRNGFVLVAGTGLDTLGGQASLLVLDPADGSVLETHALGSPATPNLVTAASAIDKDFDGFDDLLYVGDLAGRIWRVDLTTSPWTVTQLFGGSQPIQSTPVLSMNEQGQVLVFFGTGRYLMDADLTSTGTQSFYGITDNNSGTLVTRTNLVDQTTSINAIGTTMRGWYVDLVQGSGERMIRSAALIAGVLYVPSFRPNTAMCQGGGESWLYSLDFEDGSAPDNPDGTERNITGGRINSMGDGVLSSPTVDIVNEDIIMQSSNATMITRNIDVTLRRLVVRSWRQVYDREVTP